MNTVIGFVRFAFLFALLVPYEVAAADIRHMPKFDSAMSKSAGYMVVLAHGRARDGFIPVKAGLSDSIVRAIRLADPANQAHVWFKHYDGAAMFHVVGLTARQFDVLVHHPEVLTVSENRLGQGYATSADNFISRDASNGLVGFQGEGTTIAIIDSGVDITKPQFGTCPYVGAPGCRIKQLVEIAPADGFNDDWGHGTVVSLIAASVAPGANLVVLDVFQSAGSGWGAAPNHVEDALQWVVNNRANYNIVSVNLSLGSNSHSEAEDCSLRTNSTYTEALESAGVLVVAAAGNSHTETLSDQACDRSTLVVGSVYDKSMSGTVLYSGVCSDNGPVAGSVPCFSNSHEWVSTLAPGANFVVDGYPNPLNFTSFSAPFVAASAALLWPAVEGTATPSMRLSKLRSSLLAGRWISTDWAGRSNPVLNVADSLASAASYSYAAIMPIIQSYYTPSAAVHRVSDRMMLDLLQYRKIQGATNDMIRSRALAPLIMATINY